MNINIQQLKKCKSIKYFSYDYYPDTGESNFYDCEPYIPSIWDLEAEKELCNGYGVEFKWSWGF